MIIEKKPLLMNLQLFGEGGQTDPIDPQDTDPIDITELQKSMLDMKTEMEKLKQENAKLLQHNQELFLKATGEITPKEKVDSLKEYKEYVGEDFFNSLTNKQQKLLITILEGEDE